MRPVAAGVLMISLLLSGCGGDSSGALVEKLQEKYAAGPAFQAAGELTADYGEKRYVFSVRCQAAGDGGSLEITAPEAVAGAGYAWDGREGSLTYEGTELEIGARAADDLSCAEAMPLLLQFSSGGMIVDRCEETADDQVLLRVSYQSEGDAGPDAVIWYRQSDLALYRGELSVDGAVVIALTLDEFTFT